jgi:hypothetical protein
MENTMDDVKQRVGENFEGVREELGERVQEIRDTVNNYVDAKPLAAVGIAFGVGYLLSGALFSRTTFKAASIGGRFAFGGLLKQLVAGIGPGMIAAVLSGNREQAPSGGNGNRGGGQQQH